MGRTEEVVSKSLVLIEENDRIEEYCIRLYQYYFSSRVRKALFGFNSGKEKDAILNQEIEKIESLITEVKELLRQINIYFNFLQETNFFVQRRHFRLTKRFAYNAIRFSRKILALLNGIKDNLAKLERPLRPRKQQSVFHTIKKNWESLLPFFKEIKVCLYDVHGRLQIERNIITEFSHLQRSLIDEANLITGDILVSFKSKDFLKIDFGNAFLASVAASQVTHVILAVRLPMAGLKMMDSHLLKGGVTLRNFEFERGEVLIVLRPKITQGQRIQLLRNIRKHLTNNEKYDVVGVFRTIFTYFVVNKFFNQFTKGHLNMPSLSLFGASKEKLFCSQLVNELYKEAGILLTTKSRYSSSVFPSDIVASPMVQYVGLLFENSKRNEETLSRYFTNVKV